MSAPRRRRRLSPASTTEVERLLAQVEAELSGSSNKGLRELASQLAGARADDVADWDDGPEEDGPAKKWGNLDEDEEDEFEEPRAAYRYLWRGRELYPSTSPIKVEGGFEARSKRGAIGETWWSRRFLGAVEPYLVGGRSGRGRSYARRGQVVELSVTTGIVDASVQGTQRVPYRVRIAMPPASAEQWERVLVSLASQAGYSASMLAGELPHEVEDVFAGAGVPLLPLPGSRLTSDCTCPDWANPCKHVAAVCYLVAEQFDRDPFALLAWRGRSRDEVLSSLRHLRGGEVAVVADQLPATSRDMPLRALGECLAGFWKAGPELTSVQVRPVASEAAGAVLRQLPRGLVEVRGRDLGEVLAPAYQEMAVAAGKRALRGGCWEPEASPEVEPGQVLNPVSVEPG